MWWDLNTCPAPAGVEPRACIESALNKEMGYRSQVHIYAIVNLEEYLLLTPPAVKKILYQFVYSFKCV